MVRTDLVGTEDDHAAGSFQCSPLVDHADVHSGARQPVCAHEPSGASTYDEDVYVGSGGHGERTKWIVVLSSNAAIMYSNACTIRILFGIMGLASWSFRSINADKNAISRTRRCRTLTFNVLDIDLWEGACRSLGPRDSAQRSFPALF